MNEENKFQEREIQEAIISAEQRAERNTEKKVTVKHAENLILAGVDELIIMRALELLREEFEEIRSNMIKPVLGESYVSRTKVFRLMEEEKIEAVNLAIRKQHKEIREKATKSLLKDGVDILMIMKGTGLTREEIEEIQNNMSTEK